MNCVKCRVEYLGHDNCPIGDVFPDFICKKCQPDGLNLCAECDSLFISSDMDWEAYDKGSAYCKGCNE